jgi:hypothetical protein
MLSLKVGVIETVKEKVNQVGHNSFCTLCLKKVYKIVVGSRKEFNKDFTYNSYTGLLNICNGKCIKLTDNSFDITVKLSK